MELLNITVGGIEMKFRRVLARCLSVVVLIHLSAIVHGSLNVTIPQILGTASAADLVDDFKGAYLDQSQWCPCQINLAKAPVTFSADDNETGDQIAHITVDESSLGGN